MKFINHLTREEEKWITVPEYYHNSVFYYDLNSPIQEFKNGKIRYFIITGIDKINDIYYIFEITKSQHDKGLKIHDILF